MRYNYPVWTEADAKRKLYGTASYVAYTPSDGIERVFKTTIDYVGGIRPPDVEIGWEYVSDIAYDWDSGQKYKIGSVVYYNELQYIATRRYRGGGSPPNEEVDPDGIRTWMIHYEDGTTPILPFFYRKKFGYTNKYDVYPFGNYLEDIALNTAVAVFADENGEISYDPMYDRFLSQRTSNYETGSMDRKPEQALINSVMEANPYHDIYVLGQTKRYGTYPNQEEKFEFYENAVHRSELQDKLFHWMSPNAIGNNSGLFIPKRNIPDYGYRGDYNTPSFSKMQNGTSIEYYPEIQSSDFEIISPEYYKKYAIWEDWRYGLFTFNSYSINEITPLNVFVSDTPEWEMDPLSGNSYFIGDGGATVWVSVQNICVDNVLLSLYFASTYIQYVIKYDEDGQPYVEALPPVTRYFKKSFVFNGETRISSKNNTTIFKGQCFKPIPNPEYDPNCEPTEGDENTPPSVCPQEYIFVVDSDFPDTRISLNQYLVVGAGHSWVSFVGFEIN